MVTPNAPWQCGAESRFGTRSATLFSSLHWWSKEEQFHSSPRETRLRHISLLRMVISPKNGCARVLAAAVVRPKRARSAAMIPPTSHASRRLLLSPARGKTTTSSLPSLSSAAVGWLSVASEGQSSALRLFVRCSGFYALRRSVWAAPACSPSLQPQPAALACSPSPNGQKIHSKGNS